MSSLCAEKPERQSLGIPHANENTNLRVWEEALGEIINFIIEGEFVRITLVAKKLSTIIVPIERIENSENLSIYQNAKNIAILKTDTGFRFRILKDEKSKIPQEAP
jgi:hypothetical protein